MALHLHIDPFSGVAGDMFLGALIDLGVELDAVRAALAPLGVVEAGWLTAERATRRGIAAVDFRVREGGVRGGGAGGEPGGGAGGHHRGHRGYRDLMAMTDRLETTERGKDRARAVVTKLAEAEAAVHGTSLDKVHFHEVGAVDSIVDLMGVAAGLELVGEGGVETLSCGPLPISRGYVRCDHGLMPVPAPATARLMRGLATVGVDRVGELVTPTGAALVAGLCGEFGPAPAMRVTGVGHGAGDRDDPDVPNVLRLWLGERAGDAAAQTHHHHAAGHHSHDHGHGHDHAHEHDHGHGHHHHGGHHHHEHEHDPAPAAAGAGA